MASRNSYYGGELESEEDEYFQKTKRISDSHEWASIRGITPNKSPGTMATLEGRFPKRLEEFSFILDEDLKKTKFSNRFLDGFVELGMEHMYEDILQEFKESARVNPQQDYWLDTSFMIKPGMLNGLHPRYGKLKICETSFIYATTRGLSGVDDIYKEMLKEVRATNKDHNIELRKMIYQENVNIAPQIEKEVIAGRSRYFKMMNGNKEKNQNYYRAIKRRYHRTRLLISDLISKREAMGNPQKSNYGLESKIFQQCEDLAEKAETGTSETDNHLVAHAITYGLQTGRPQIILTRDNGIFKLAKEIEKGENSLIPKINLNHEYFYPTKLHKIELDY